MSYLCKSCGAWITDDIINKPTYKCWKCGAQFNKDDITELQKGELSSDRLFLTFLAFILGTPALGIAAYYYHKKYAIAKLSSSNINKKKLAFEAFLLFIGLLFIMVGIFTLFEEPILAVITMLIATGILFFFRRTKRKREGNG